MSSRKNHAKRSHYSAHASKPFQGFYMKAAARADRKETNDTFEKLKETFKKIVKGEGKDGVQTSQS